MPKDQKITIPFDPVLKNIADECAKNPHVLRAVLFGSRARGEHHPKSDYDIALFFSDDSNEEERARFTLDLNERSPSLLKLDIVIWAESLNQKLKERIESEGKSLYETPRPVI